MSKRVEAVCKELEDCIKRLGKECEDCKEKRDSSEKTFVNGVRKYLKEKNPLRVGRRKGVTE